MASSKARLAASDAIPFKSKNKEKRRAFVLKQKRALESVKRDAKFKRKREEAKIPGAAEQRRAKNVPQTIDRKRVWDEMNADVDVDDENILGVAVDVEESKRRKLEAEQELPEEDEEDSEGEEDEDDDIDSMLEESDEDNDEEAEDEKQALKPPKQRKTSPSPRIRAGSPTGSTTSTNLDLRPAALVAKFPTLFEPPSTPPKVLITTSINSTLHDQARLLTTLFPNSVYIPRSSHRYGHKFSVREISQFAANRSYTTVIVLEEDLKRPYGLTVVHLPAGPTFHFSISNWVEGAKLPGHGNPTNHYPELILNNFRTPLGILTARLFRTMFPPDPEVQGRQVVTLHNQRDYIFVRRHRYIFREKRTTEKSVVGADGKPMGAVEDIRAGLQELGPRFTLKLRRIDKGIQKKSGQEWEWKAGMEKVRTKFQL